MPGASTNTATATADFGATTLTHAASETVTASSQTPAFTLAKTASSPTYSAVGDVITYTYTLTNTGNVTLSAATLVDDKLGAGVFTPAFVAPAGTLSTTLAHTIDQADIDAGRIDNTATATADFGATTLTHAASETVTASSQTPAFTLAKTASSPTYSAVGDVITYTYTLTNTGNVTLSAATLVDDKLGAGVFTPAFVAPAGTLSTTLAHTIDQADIDAGRIDQHRHGHRRLRRHHADARGL